MRLTEKMTWSMIHRVFLASLLLTVSQFQDYSYAQPDSSDKTNQPTFVLVHGTFQWGGQWAPLCEVLEAKGYSVHAPSLSGLGDREHLLSKQVGLSTHIADIENYVKWRNLSNVILVGHSYGGAVITGVADRLPDRVAHVVYVDATLMENGESVLLDHFAKDMVADIRHSVEREGDGWLLIPEFLRDPAPSTMRKHPFKSYTDRIDLKNGPPERGTVIVATETPGVFAVLRSNCEERAKKLGWSFHVVDGPHPLQEKGPSKDKVAKILLGIAASFK